MQLYVLGNVESCRAAHDVQMGAVKRKLKLSVVRAFFFITLKPRVE